MLFGPESTLAQTQKVTLTLYCEETPKYVAEQLEAGSEAWDAESNVTLGTLTEWRTGESVSAVTDITGQVVEISARTTALSRSQSRATASSATTA